MTTEHAIINKILSAGSPLSDWNVKVHCGIGAGFRKTFVVDDESDEGKYVCAMLNSNLARWFKMHGGANCGRIEALPIPNLASDELQEVLDLVEEMITAKERDPHADTWYKEFELNDLIYDLYDITGEEEGIIIRDLGLEDKDVEYNAGETAAASDESEEDWVSKDEIAAILRAGDAD